MTKPKTWWTVMVLYFAFLSVGIGWSVISHRNATAACARKVCPDGTKPELLTVHGSWSPTCICPIPAKDPTP